MNKFWMAIDWPFRMICLGLLYFYKFCISPLKPKCCKFSPTCSTYSVIAIKRFGSIKGIVLTFKRLLRCNHKSMGGVDAVPDSIFGQTKFII